MKTIIEDRKGSLTGYAELDKEEQFIYITSPYEFFAIKVNDEYAVFINARNKFIVAKAYKNILSIGTSSIELASYDEAVE